MFGSRSRLQSLEKAMTGHVSVHMYASAVSAALVSRTVDTHGSRSSGATAYFSFEGEEFALTHRSRSSLSWMCALSGRNTFLGSPKSYIDPLSLTGTTSERTAAADINALAMCTWREECNAISGSWFKVG